MSGDFDVAGATQAFELLEEEKLYGSITISDGMLDLCCFFTRGGLRVISAGRELPSLRRRLVADGLLKEDDARRVAQALARPGQQREERDILLQEIGLKPPEVDAVVRELLEDVILDCLFWEDPQYEVATGEPDLEVMQRRDLSALTLSIGVPALITAIKQRVRSVAEVRRTVSSMDVSVEPTTKGRAAAEQGQPLGEGQGGRARLRFLRAVVDQPGQGARELGSSLRVGELEVANRVHELALKGLVEIKRKPRDKKAELERIRQMEEAIDQALNQLLRRMRLAKNSAAQGDPTRAARHMARAGGLLMAQGRSEEAVRTFSDALRHSEDDLEAREGYVQGLWATNRQEEAARASEDLGRRYLGLNLPGRARRVLERALGFREETPTLQLFVQSLVKLKRHKAATEAGQRLINRLRREGRADEARTLAGDLMAMGDADDRRRLARAAGVSALHLLALLLVGVSLGAGYFPLQALAREQQEYQQLTRGISDRLTQAKTYKEVMPALDDALRALAPVAEGEGPAAAAAKEASRKVEQIRTDLQKAKEVVSRLPWKDTPNVEELGHQLELLAGGVSSEALSIPLLRLKRELDEFRKGFSRLRGQLMTMPSDAQALELARRIRADYASLPTGLEQTLIPVQILSEPPGATVEVDGVEFSKVTPEAVLNLPLRGTVRLRLSLADHEPQVREVTFDDLGAEPRVEFTLEPSGGGPSPRPSPTARPTATARPSPTATPRPSPSPSPSSSASSGWTSYVMLREGIAQGTPGGGATLEFTQEPDFFAELKLDSRFRALVQTINEVEGSKVYWTGFQITLYVRRSRGWATEKPLDVELDERYPRAVVRHPGNRLRVGALSRTVHVDLGYLRRVVEEGVDRRVRELGRREDR